jgi:hypothetical protein
MLQTVDTGVFAAFPFAQILGGLDDDEATAIVRVALVTKLLVIIALPCLFWPAGECHA